MITAELIKEHNLSEAEYRQILEILSNGTDSFGAIFAASSDREESVFMGDCILWSYVERIRGGRTPLVEGSRQKLRLTAAGEDVLHGRADAIALNGIDRWLGGAHLSGPDAEWRWDRERRKLARKESAGADRR